MGKGSKKKCISRSSGSHCSNQSAEMAIETHPTFFTPHIYHGFNLWLLDQKKNRVPRLEGWHAIDKQRNYFKKINLKGKYRSEESYKDWSLLMQMFFYWGKSCCA